MEYHRGISFFKNPWIWLEDKYKTGLNRKATYIIASLPALLLLAIGFLSDLFNLSGKNKLSIGSNPEVFVLTISTFVFALLCLIFVCVIQRMGVRLGTERQSASIIHKNVVEEIREYKAFKATKAKKKEQLKCGDIEKQIRNILISFNDNYMKQFHRRKVSAVIKYLKNEKLYPIRIGGDIVKRKTDPEDIDNSFVYKALNEPGKKLSYIYVKNLDNPDKYECAVLGRYKNEICGRAKGKYNTFVALPIRAGRLEGNSSEFTTRPDLGFLGFDLMEKYGFGNLYKYEIDFMACLVDLLSEPVQDLIMSKHKESKRRK
jgi:hypothetical protein